MRYAVCLGSDEILLCARFLFLDQAVSDSMEHEFQAIIDAQLIEDVCKVVLDGLLAYR